MQRLQIYSEYYEARVGMYDIGITLVFLRLKKRNEEEKKRSEPEGRPKNV
ncbi:hypothetical protein ABXS75_16545 [Roseburia hominis]